jgi:putative ABC transport system substrate-binding protein
MAVIGYEAGAPFQPASDGFLANVRKELAEFGYIEGQNYRFEFHDGGGKYDLMPALARELVNQKVTLIITQTTLQTAAAKAATQSIPIVFNIGLDPIENGFVASLSQPGGNTGNVKLTEIQMRSLQPAADALGLSLLNVKAHIVD